MREFYFLRARGIEQSGPALDFWHRTKSNTDSQICEKRKSPRIREENYRLANYSLAVNRRNYRGPLEDLGKPSSYQRRIILSAMILSDESDARKYGYSSLCLARGNSTC